MKCLYCNSKKFSSLINIQQKKIDVGKVHIDSFPYFYPPKAPCRNNSNKFYAIWFLVFSAFCNPIVALPMVALLYVVSEPNVGAVRDYYQALIIWKKSHFCFECYKIW